MVDGGKVSSSHISIEDWVSVVDNGFGKLDADINLGVLGFVGFGFGVTLWEKEAFDISQVRSCKGRKKKILKG